MAPAIEAEACNEAQSLCVWRVQNPMVCSQVNERQVPACRHYCMLQKTQSRMVLQRQPLAGMRGHVQLRAHLQLHRVEMQGLMQRQRTCCKSCRS